MIFNLTLQYLYALGGGDCAQFLIDTREHVRCGHLRLCGKLNGRGDLRLVDSSAMTKFCFRFLANGAGCLVHERIIRRSSDIDTEIRIICSMSHELTHVITDLYFCKEDTDAIWRPAPSAGRAPPIEPQADPVPSRLSEATVRDILRKVLAEDPGIERDLAVAKVRAAAGAEGSRIGRDNWVRKIFYELTGNRRQGRPPKNKD